MYPSNYIEYYRVPFERGLSSLVFVDEIAENFCPWGSFHLVAHFANPLRTYSSSFAWGISGILYFWRYLWINMVVTSPSRSRSNSLSERTVLLILGSILFNSLNRLTSLVLRFFSMERLHLLPNPSHMSTTSHFLYLSFLGKCGQPVHVWCCKGVSTCYLIKVTEALVQRIKTKIME